MIRWLASFLLLLLVTVFPFTRTQARPSVAMINAEIRHLHNLKVENDGPNCWNAALQSAGLVHSTRFVSKGEYWFWMKSNNCVAVAPGDKLQSGDLGSLIWKGYGHYHSFVYLDEHLVFSKTSPSSKHPYRIQAFEEMFSADERESVKNCWPLAPNHNNKNCELEIVFHRCRPLEKGFYHSDPQLAEWDLKLKGLEEIIDRRSKASEGVAPQVYQRSMEQLYQLLRQVQRASSNGKNETIKNQRGALEYRILGLMLADVNGVKSAPSVYPYLAYAYAIQKDKKNQVPRGY